MKTPEEIDKLKEGLKSCSSDEVIIEAGPGQEQKAEWTSGSAQQNGMPVVNNNPIFIQQNGDGNMVIPNYGTININKR